LDVQALPQQGAGKSILSTLKKIGGKQFGGMRDNRKAALKFYRDKTRLPGMAGALAAEIYRTLYAIHRDPTLNSPEKEDAYRNIIRRFAKPDRVGDAAGVSAASAKETLRMAGLSAIEGVPATDGE